MAPRGKASTPAGRPPGLHRGTSISASRGGAIQKRRANDRARIDKDGDLMMDAGSARKRRGGGGAHGARGARGGARHVPLAVTRARQQAIINNLARGPGSVSSKNCTTLKVTGLQESKAASNEDGGLQDLLFFIERKAPTAAKLNRTIRIRKARVEGSHVWIFVSKDDSEAILAVNNFGFAGVTLKIEPGPDTFPPEVLSETAQAAKDQLTAILQKRYNPTDKFLDLSALGADSDLNGIGALEPGVMPEKLFKALMKICDDTFTTPDAKREAVICVSLAQNALTDVHQVWSLADTFPHLKQMDLSNNSIAAIKGLSSWKSKFRHLEGLLLIDNPICVNEIGFGDELLKWYPRLQNLNHVQARTPEQAEAAAAEASVRRQPIPVSQTAAVYMDNSGIGEPFIREFVPGYDTNRAGLLAKYYDEDSIFSLNVDTNAIKSVKTLQPMGWASYIRLSRNLLRITTKGGRFQRCFRGASIGQLWNQLPKTKHPDLAAEFGKYIIECREQDHVPDPSGNSAAGVVGLHIVITGEFEELDPNTGNTGKRSFTRSIILGPGRQGGQPIRIVSDLLSLRAFRGVPPVSEVQQNVQKVQELSEATKLTLGYAEMCLGDVAYDYAAALRLFEEKKNELPPDAFITNGL